VRVNPSRVGSSPNLTIISRTNSSKLALVIVGLSTELFTDSPL
jgi:hypothetical protein